MIFNVLLLQVEHGNKTTTYVLEQFVYKAKNTEISDSSMNEN